MEAGAGSEWNCGKNRVYYGTALFPSMRQNEFKRRRKVREQLDAPIKIKFKLTVAANGSLLPLPYC